MKDKNNILRHRLHNVMVHNPMSLTDLAKSIGVSFNTLKKFMEQNGILNASPLLKIERFVFICEQNINK